MTKVRATPYDIKLPNTTVGAKRKQPEPLTLDEQLADAEATMAIYHGLWEQVAENRAEESHARLTRDSYFLSLPTESDEAPHRMG